MKPVRVKVKVKGTPNPTQEREFRLSGMDACANLGGAPDKSTREYDRLYRKKVLGPSQVSDKPEGGFQDDKGGYGMGIGLMGLFGR